MLGNYDELAPKRRQHCGFILNFLSQFDHSFLRSGVKEDHTANYFSHGNEEATRLRDSLAEDSLEMLIRWLKEGGNVGIHGYVPGALML